MIRFLVRTLIRAFVGYLVANLIYALVMSTNDIPRWVPITGIVVTTVLWPWYRIGMTHPEAKKRTKRWHGQIDDAERKITGLFR